MVSLTRTVEIELLLRNMATAGLRAAGNDVARFSRTAEAETRKTDLAFKVLNKSTSVLIGAVSGLAVGALFQLIGAFSESEEKVDDLSEKILKLADSTKFLSFEFQRIAEAGKGGFSDERTASIVTILAKSIDEAQKGTKLFAKAFEDIGVPVKTATGQLRQLEDVLRDLDDVLLTTTTKRGGFAAIFGNEAETSRARQVIRELVTNLDQMRDLPDTQKILAEARIRRFNEVLETASKETESIKKAEKEKEKIIEDARKKSESDAKKSAETIEQINEDLAKRIGEAQIELIKDPIEKINAEYEKQIKLVRELSLLQSTQGSGVNQKNISSMIDLLDQLRAKEISAAKDVTLKSHFEDMQNSAIEAQAEFDAMAAIVGEWGEKLSSDFFDVVIAKTNTWKNVLAALSRELFVMASKALLVAAFKQVFAPSPVGLAKGGVIPGGTKAFQTGGMITQPTLALMGEGKNAEAVVPLPDNRSIPVKMTGNTGGSLSINLQISAMDGPSVRDFFSRNRREVISILRSAMRSDYTTRAQISTLA